MPEIFNEAIIELKETKSVEEWNEIRDKYKRFVTTKELAFIDASGLITEVLGCHPIKTYSHDN